jgi:hypothetical protein
MDSPIKVQVSVGPSQFTMEGREQVVIPAYNAWLSAVSQPPAIQPASKPLAPLGQTTTKTGDPADPEALRREDGNGTSFTAIFGVDDRSRVLTLKVRPEGESAEADALLLFLYGYRNLQQTDEVLVGKLKSSLELTGGLNVGRIDRVIGRYVDDRLVLKVGKQGPGGKYRLTATGMARAEAIARTLSEHII